MTASKKSVEFFVVDVKVEKAALPFEKILLSDYVEEYMYWYKGKWISLSILEKGATIIGIVGTTRASNIPPKKSIKKKTVSAVGLTADEGLLYGNVFLYEKKRGILLYEVNKPGCHIDHFLWYLQKCCKEQKEKCDWDFSLSVTSILRPDEYKRLKKMAYYKSIELEFANPAELVKQHVADNVALEQGISLGARLHAKTFSCRYEVESKRQGGTGLANKTFHDVVDFAHKLSGSPAGENVTKIKVWGYAQDGEDSDRMEPIDLLADRYLGRISLDEPIQNIDLLEGQRAKAIRELYNDSTDDFDVMFAD